MSTSKAAVLKVVTYARVSTGKQERSGLGMEAQADYIAHAVAANSWEVVGAFEDAGLSGGLSPEQRPGLAAALELCKETGAALLVAKVDRLSRSVADTATIMECVNVKVATMPHADNFQLHLFAALAQQEKEFIQSRTRDALRKLQDRADNGDAVAVEKVARRNGNSEKARASGDALRNSLAVRQARADAFAATVDDNILAAKSRGYTTLQAIADYLNDKKITTSRGAKWTPIAVSRIIERTTKAAV